MKVSLRGRSRRLLALALVLLTLAVGLPAGAAVPAHAASTQTSLSADDPGPGDQARHDAAQPVDGALLERPTLLNPPDGARTTGRSDPPIGLPGLAWLPVPGATRYHVQVSASAGFADTLVDKDTYATRYQPDRALADGTYFWRVKARIDTTWGEYSDVWSFTKDWSDDGSIRPELVFPPEGAERASFQPQDFTWTPVPGAATYRLEISADQAFSNPIYSATTIKARHTPVDRLPNNLYYWRVIPVDRRGNMGTASDIGSFTFNWDLAPALLAPEDGVDLAFLPRFSWTAVEAAKEYWLEISTQPDFSTSVSAYRTDHTDYTPEKALANDQDYYWRVRATDYEGTNGPWSVVRRFRMRWNFRAQLLTPQNNAIRTSYPFFSWTPIPGSERYQIQIDKSTSFSSPIADEKIYNSPTYTQPGWAQVVIDGDYFWRVRGLDAQDNLTPWSDLRSFRPSYTSSPNQVYPLFYYEPDDITTPIHEDRTIAWPLFVWDIAYIYIPDDTPRTLIPDYYELAADDDPAFGSPNFRVETAGIGAAPTSTDPFTGLQDGQRYYWRVRAYRDGSQIGTDSVWITRYDSKTPQLPFADIMTLIHPADGFQAVDTPPVLGWLPLNGSGSYQVQVSKDRNFAQVVDDVVALAVNYVPWQGRREPMPNGSYWWRVRSANPRGPWSEVRRFDLSVDLIAGNPTDFVPPPRPDSLLASTASYDPSLTYVDASPSMAAGPFDLGALHVMLDRTYSPINYSWVIAFGSGATAADTLRYGLYFDIDHVEGSGAPGDPLGKPITTDLLYRPEYVLYITREAGDLLSPENTLYFHWNGSGWDPPQTLAAIGGDVWFDPANRDVQALIPYTALGASNPQSAGSLALTVFTTGTDSGDGAHDSVPAQGSVLDRPAFVSDMLMPLFPFDTPLSNPVVYYDMPTLRWRMPYFDSVDGYQVEVARDAAFTQVVETWETYESKTWSYFALMPTAFQSQKAYEDNESYYWRVRIRHERYLSNSSFFDYGPWSPPMRFSLDSRQVGNPQPPSGTVVAAMPTLTWNRVEGAAGYVLQVDDDANFSSPTIANKKLDGTSYTPVDAIPDGTYHWRVAMRRSDRVIGHWTPAMQFVKRSTWPTPLSPTNDEILNGQPTFQWSPVLTPTIQPRLAAPRYRLQIASDPNFSTPKTINTTATTYTLRRSSAETLADGTWFWRVAILDANGKLGSYSPTQRFYKEYLPPELLAPPQGGSTPGIPTFEWAPVDGAAYYKIQIADNPLFNGVIQATTDNTCYTPTNALTQQTYYWRVQMYDIDNKAGPFQEGKVRLGSFTYVPLMLR